MKSAGSAGGECWASDKRAVFPAAAARANRAAGSDLALTVSAVAGAAFAIAAAGVLSSRVSDSR